MEMLAYLAVAALFVLLGVVIDIAVNVRRLRSVVTNGLHYFMFEHHAYPSGPVYNRYEGGFCIWVFRGGKWTLEADFCEEGYEPGAPPSRTGDIEGYAIRQLGVKKRPG